MPPHMSCLVGIIKQTKRNVSLPLFPLLLLFVISFSGGNGGGNGNPKTVGPSSHFTLTGWLLVCPLLLSADFGSYCVVIRSCTDHKCRLFFSVTHQCRLLINCLIAIFSFNNLVFAQEGGQLKPGWPPDSTGLQTKPAFNEMSANLTQNLVSIQRSLVLIPMDLSPMRVATL